MNESSKRHSKLISLSFILNCLSKINVFHFNKKKVMFIDNKRVFVIKQSIMIFTVEKQYELSLIIGILLKH